MATPNVTEIVKTLRSLLNSSQNGLTERQLWRDFRETEGYAVPFKELGFRTFLQFLIDTKQFELLQTQDGVQIYAKLSKDSVHIAQLVASQNRVKPRKKATKPISMPRNAQQFRRGNNYAQAANVSQSHGFLCMFLVVFLLVDEFQERMFRSDDRVS